MNEDVLMPAIIGLIISLLLMMLIIRWAVAPYLKDIIKELKISNRFKYLDLKKQGVSNEEMKAEVQQIKP